MFSLKVYLILPVAGIIDITTYSCTVLLLPLCISLPTSSLLTIWKTSLISQSRVWIQVYYSVWVNDWLMVARLLVFTGTCVSISIMDLYGGGTRIVRPEPRSTRDDRRYFFLVLILHVASTALIRVSVCVSCVRIAVRRGIIARCIFKIADFCFCAFT